MHERSKWSQNYEIFLSTHLHSMPAKIPQKLLKTKRTHLMCLPQSASQQSHNYKQSKFMVFSNALKT